jgi:hypothetical protein
MCLFACAGPVLLNPVRVGQIANDNRLEKNELDATK